MVAAGRKETADADDPSGRTTFLPGHGKANRGDVNLSEFINIVIYIIHVMSLKSNSVIIDMFCVCCLLSTSIFCKNGRSCGSWIGRIRGLRLVQAFQKRPH